MSWFAWDDDDDREVHLEDGHILPRGHRTGRAGKGPGSRLQDSPKGGWGRSWTLGGPTRGTSQTLHDRKGGWLFGGRRAGPSKGKGGKH